MFSDTYTRITSRSEKEYVYMRQGLLLDLLHRTPSTPPIITLFAMIGEFILRKLGRPGMLGHVNTSVATATAQISNDQKRRRSFLDFGKPAMPQASTPHTVQRVLSSAR